MASTATAALLGPTRERLGKAADFEAPITDDKRRRTAWRLISIAESMHRACKLSDEQLAAFRQFERDLALSEIGNRVTSRYGAQAGSGGTPLMQLSVMALAALSPAERRSDAIDRLSDACNAIGEPQSVELLMYAAFGDVTAEGLGRDVLLISNKAQAIAAAHRTLQTGTYALAQHYGYVPPLKPPEAA